MRVVQKCIPCGKVRDPLLVHGGRERLRQHLEEAIVVRPVHVLDALFEERARTASVPRCLQATIVACFALESRSRERGSTFLEALVVGIHSGKVPFERFHRFFLGLDPLECSVKVVQCLEGAFPSNSRSIFVHLRQPLRQRTSVLAVFFIFANTGGKGFVARGPALLVPCSLGLRLFTDDWRIATCSSNSSSPTLLLRFASPGGERDAGRPSTLSSMRHHFSSFAPYRLSLFDGEGSGTTMVAMAVGSMGSSTLGASAFWEAF